MPVVLKSQRSAVVDALRASRNADDELSRLQENSWERQRSSIAGLVESANWRYGPAALLATFDHHAVVKAPGGALVQVEWSKNSEGAYKLGRATVYETATPIADLGQELMETARSAVDLILAEQFDEALPMVTTIAEALDAGGDLQRRVNTEVTLRSLTRDAWWHGVVGLREGIEQRLPQPVTEGEDFIDRSVNELLIFLKESAGEASEAIRALADTDIAKDVETLARDVVEDAARAIDALVGTNTERQEETLQVYEAVMAAAPQLLNGVEFLKELAASNDELGPEGAGV